MTKIDQKTFYEKFEKKRTKKDGKYTPTFDLNVLLTLAWHFRPKHFLEFGVQEGTTAGILLELCPWIEKYTGIDVPPNFKTKWKAQQSEVPKKAGGLVDDPRFNVIVLEKGTAELEVNKMNFVDCCFFVDLDKI